MYNIYMERSELLQMQTKWILDLNVRLRVMSAHSILSDLAIPWNTYNNNILSTCRGDCDILCWLEREVLNIIYAVDTF